MESGVFFGDKSVNKGGRFKGSHGKAKVFSWFFALLIKSKSKHVHCAMESNSSRDCNRISSAGSVSTEGKASDDGISCISDSFLDP